MWQHHNKAQKISYNGCGLYSSVACVCFPPKMFVKNTVSIFWKPCWTTQLTAFSLLSLFNLFFPVNLVFLPFVLKHSSSSGVMRARRRGVGTLFCLLILLGLLDVYVAHNWPSALRQTGSKTHQAGITVMGWASAGDVFTRSPIHCLVFARRAMRQVFSALSRWGRLHGGVASC